MMEKKGEPGFSGLAALTELLKTKGVLSAGEADKVAKKCGKGPSRSCSPPSGTGRTSSR